MSERGELWVGLLAFLPLAYITWQVYQLRRILYSRAWTMLLVGFAAFAALRGAVVFLDLPLVLRLAVYVFGYTILGAGFHMLRDDLMWVLRHNAKNGEGAE